MRPGKMRSVFCFFMKKTNKWRSTLVVNWNEFRANALTQSIFHPCKASPDRIEYIVMRAKVSQSTLCNAFPTYNWKSSEKNDIRKDFSLQTKSVSVFFCSILHNVLQQILQYRRHNSTNHWATNLNSHIQTRFWLYSNEQVYNYTAIRCLI